MLEILTAVLATLSIHTSTRNAQPLQGHMPGSRYGIVGFRLGQN